MLKFNGIGMDAWCEQYPLLKDIISYRETAWFNPQVEKCCVALAKTGFSKADIAGAADRLNRFRPFIANAFPQTRAEGGLIESPLQEIPAMQRELGRRNGCSYGGSLYLKCDNLLPISGSVKARGGIYEVLKYAEHVALENNILTVEDDYSKLAEEPARILFGNHRIAVGSTGNLGLSIGIIGAAFGFKVTVHMSADAKNWKKALLRSHGVEVIEYEADYSKAVAEGRRQADGDSHCYFIDDENSTDLFLGYAVAAGRLRTQFDQQNIVVDKLHPLFVYLPCGVGGGPGGITYGLKEEFGDNVHCFFAEPTHSPCMFLGLYTGLHDKVSVKDFGLNNKTDADGLAVGRPSGFIGKIMAPMIDGVFTVTDDEMYRLLALLKNSEGIEMEPSALAGMVGMARVQTSPLYLKQHQLTEVMVSATHLVWGTGGSMVPRDEMENYQRQGNRLLTAVSTENRSAKGGCS